MVRILLVLLFVLQAASSYASGSLVMSDAPILESSPKSKEIKKIVKLVEDPVERGKLLKTLKVLASAQEAEEKKRGGTLVAYLTPIIQYGMDSASAFFMNLKKIPGVANGVIDHFKIENNREDFWVALKWFPLLIIIGAILEGALTWFFQRRLITRQPLMEAEELIEKKSTYAYMTLFYPFLYTLLFLPIFVASPSIGNWIIGFWLTLFGFRIFLLERKMSHIASLSSSKKRQEMSSKGGAFLRVLGGVLLWAVLMSGFNIVLDIKSYGDDFVLNLILLMSFPLLVLYFREWRANEMSRHLVDSRSLATTPQQIAPLMNLFIRYLPWLLLLASIPLGIDKVFSEGNLWETYGPESIETLFVLITFLWGRRQMDVLAQYKIPKGKAPKVQAFTSYLSPLQTPFIRIVQWLLHLSFFVILIAIWNNFFSSLFVSIVSHPMTKTMTTIGMIWGIIYLIWLGLDFFVQFHTKPQTIKGKQREPTVFAKTFGPMLHSVARWIMVLVAFFVTLESFGFDLKILVYVMSAFALAISLGSQSLVKDIINGFFALVDGSFAVGDVVTIGAHTGTVEALSLRAITLRHRDGSLQTIPFSEVGNIINRSRDYMVVPIDVATSYKTKVSKVYEALTLAAEEMALEPTFGKMILEPLSFSGVDRFAENSVHVSASIKITPDPNNAFAREFNRRLKIHLDALGVAPPIAFQERWTKEPTT